ncbi:MAG: hypothetical protein JSR82_07000 [Verrucomicrobia bacterium]|nr:hypothetical protein [Verrucomicrobiota bacterium]
MKHLLAILSLLFVCLPAASGQDVTKYSPETILQLIKIHERDPISERGVAARAVILEFADKSDTVLINISERAMPWEADQRTPEAARRVLTGAYVAGNVRSQLERKVNANDSLAGWASVFRAYEALRKHSRGIRIASVEALLEEEKNGQLKARAMEVDGQDRESA